MALPGTDPESYVTEYTKITWFRRLLHAIRHLFEHQHRLTRPHLFVTSATPEIDNLVPNNQRQRRTCYALCHILYPMSAAHTSIFRMDSNSTSYFCYPTCLFLKAFLE